MQNETKKLNGICCEVKNCIHNDGHACSTANNIKVKTRMRFGGKKTMCDSYKHP